MTEPVYVTLDEAVPLVHAVVAAAAERLGIRVLFIKGPTLAIQGLREPRTSSDVDVLCDPARTDDLAAGLEALGWRRFLVEDTGPRVLEPYAVSYVHDTWPCGVDVHHVVPGFYRPPHEVFDALADRGTSIELAARPIPTCDLLGSALVQALHLERNRTTNWYRSDREFLVRSLRDRLSPAQLHDVAELASTTGSVDVLHAFLDEVGAPPIGLGQTSRTDLDEWNLRAAEDETQVILWIEELRQARIRDWPRIAWRGLSYDDRARMDANHQISTRASGPKISLRIRRLWKALRYSPAAVHRLIRLRRQR